MILEMRNLTDKPLTMDQTIFGLEAERRDLITNKAICSGSLGPGSVFGGEIAPGGVVRVSSNIWPWVSEGLGCPPKTGLKVIASLRLNLTTGRGRGHFVSPPRDFAFDWIYPDEKGVGDMKGRLKELLLKPQYTFEHGAQLRMLFAYPAVVEDLIAGELLDALKLRQNSVDGRDVIAGELGRRFGNDPNLVAYVGAELTKGNVSDVLVGGIWNPAFVTILVDSFEKTGSNSPLYVLGTHRGDWSSNNQVVARLSTALVKHRPLLGMNVSEIGKDELVAWTACAREAAIIGDKGLIKILAPALDDGRMAIHPDEAKMSNIPGRRRVSDHALEAIASILGVSVYQEDGLFRSRLGGLEPLANFNRAIADVKRRISELDSKQQTKQGTEQNGSGQPATRPESK
jgi:hypothetical protein